MRFVIPAIIPDATTHVPSVAMDAINERARRRLPPGVTPIEPGPGQESVWDYPRPPRVEPVTDRIRVVVGGRTLADSTDAVRVLETAGAPVYYLPQEDVRFEALRWSGRSTTCEWKGRARYLDFDDGERRVQSIAWSYPDPSPGFEILAGRVA